MIDGSKQPSSQVGGPKRSTIRAAGRMTIDGQTVRTIKLLFREATTMVERTRVGRALVSGFRTTTRSAGRVLHQLWLEVTGFTFLAIAGVGIMAVVREYGKYQSGRAPGPQRLLLAVCFTAAFAWFGLSSFWRVNRRVSKQRN